jgi:hypothetical protein
MIKGSPNPAPSRSPAWRSEKCSIRLTKGFAGSLAPKVRKNLFKSTSSCCYSRGGQFSSRSPDMNGTVSDPARHNPGGGMSTTSCRSSKSYAARPSTMAMPTSLTCAIRSLCVRQPAEQLQL